MPEEELLEFLLAFLPESLEGWAGLGFGLCAILSLALPAPAENAHPVWKAGHKVICILGLGAGKLKTAGLSSRCRQSRLTDAASPLRGKLGKVAKLGSLLRRGK